MTCCAKPRKKTGKRYSGTIEKPVTSGQDSYDQLDLHDDANWETHATRAIWVRDASVNERFVDDESVATITSIVGMWGDSTTRQLSATYRVKYTDEDGTVRKLGIVGTQRYDNGKWVEARCMELSP